MSSASSWRSPPKTQPDEPDAQALKESAAELSQGSRPTARSVMHNQYGGLLRRLFEWLFGPIEYPREAAEAIRELAQRGTVVYVAQARTSLLGLYFNHAMSRLGLPLARFVGGINLLLWQPVDRLWKLWRRQRHPPSGPWRQRYTDRQPTSAEALFADIVLAGEPAFLFLAPPHRRRRLAQLAPQNDYMRALVAAQRNSVRPIFILPHALVGRSQSGAVRGPLTARLFGNAKRRGRLRELALLLYPSSAFVRVADPIDVQRLVAQSDQDDEHLARRLAHEVHRRIREEERVIAGPDLPSFETTRRHVLRAQEVRQAVDRLASRGDKSAATLKRRAKTLISEIAARYNVNAIRFLDAVMSWVFKRIYDGMVVDADGLARVLEAARRGPVIFCPSHKSHVDYLVLSYVLWRYGVTPPHIAAGANLSFFPLGTLFRRSGAFFLRRSFRDDELYRAIFRSYVHELVRTGTAIEFFIEGSRSRNGKLLLPKFGILGMIVDAWRAGARDDVQLVPLSIDYERIIESSSYERELLGGEKRPEDIGALLRTTRVLRSRYGRVHVQFGEPLSLAREASRSGLQQTNAPAQDDAWRAEIERLGYRILHRVSRVTTVTPTAVVATALLGHAGRGLAESSLLKLAGAIIDYLDTEAARLSESLVSPDTRDAALLEAVQKLVENGSISLDRPGRSDVEPIYRALEHRRLALDFHKNSLMNHFAPAAIIARSLVRYGGTKVPYRDLHQDARFLSRLFKREFVYRVDANFDTHFDDTLASLAIRALIDVLDDGTVVVRDLATIRLLAGLLDGFVQAYWVVTTTLPELKRFPLWDKELATRALDRARRAFLEGAVSRPESANRTLIESALGWMIATGVVDAKSEGRRKRLQLSEAYDGSALDELIADIGAFL